MAVFDPERARSLFAMAEDIIGDRVAPLTFQHELALARVEVLQREIEATEKLCGKRGTAIRNLERHAGKLEGTIDRAGFAREHRPPDQSGEVK